MFTSVGCRSTAHLCGKRDTRELLRVPFELCPDSPDGGPCVGWQGPFGLLSLDSLEEAEGNILMSLFTFLKLNDL